MPVRIIQGASFDLETKGLLGIAYERACESVAPDVKVREVLAKASSRPRSAASVILRT
jgi:hypothetical protein